MLHGDVRLEATHAQIGVQSQTFTIVNDEDYYYPDLMRGMIVEGTACGAEITGYTGSTTGTTRNNEVCSPRARRATWHRRPPAPRLPASLSTRCARTRLPARGDMSGDFYAHGAREVVADSLTANNKVNLKTRSRRPQSKRPKLDVLVGREESERRASLRLGRPRVNFHAILSTRRAPIIRRAVRRICSTK